jgi:type I restriction enzyme, R subunit
VGARQSVAPPDGDRRFRQRPAAPVVPLQLKNVSKDIRAAYEQNSLDYKDTVPHLFHHNALVSLANGVDAKLGSVTSPFEHFHDWKRLAEDQPSFVDMGTLLKGVCEKTNFLDRVDNFIIFDESAGDSRKILARYHQFLGVSRAVEAVHDRKRLNGKPGGVLVYPGVRQELFDDVFRL